MGVSARREAVFCLLYKLVVGQSEAHRDGGVHLLHHLLLHMAHPFPQPLFVQRPHLLQQDDGVPVQAAATFTGRAIWVGRRALPVCEVIAAAMTVGLYRLPVSF